MSRRQNYTREELEKALKEISTGVISIHEATKRYKIPRGTLQNRIHGRTKSSSFGPSPVLTEKEEEKIVEWIKTNEMKGFPRRKLDIKISVKEFLDSCPRQNPFKDNLPGDTWFRGFLKRHPEITERTPEAVTDASSKVSENDIRKWFTQISEYLKKKNYIDILEDPTRVYNGDETNFQMCPKSGKVIASKGARNVYETDRGQAKENLTVMFTFSAAGLLVPPMIIYPYKRIPQVIMESIPDGIYYQKTDNGWMTSEIFCYYIKEVFNPFLVKEQVKFPVILFVDGHTTHVSYTLSKLCEELKIILICLYPNCTRILQPADVSVFRPLKIGWQNAALVWRRHNINAKLTKKDFARLLQEVVKNHIKKEYIENGFRTCGLYPFDPNAIDYAKCLGKSIQTSNTEPQAGTSSAAEGQKSPGYHMNFKDFQELVGSENMKLFENFNSSQSTFNEHFLILYKMYEKFKRGEQFQDQEVLFEYDVPDDQEPIMEYVADDEEAQPGPSQDVFPTLHETMAGPSQELFCRENEVQAGTSTNIFAAEAIDIENLSFVFADELSPIENFLPEAATPKRTGARNTEKQSFIITSSAFQKHVENKMTAKQKQEEQRELKRKMREEKKREKEELKKRKQGRKPKNNKENIESDSDFIKL